MNPNVNYGAYLIYNIGPSVVKTVIKINVIKMLYVVLEIVSNIIYSFCAQKFNKRNNIY